MRTVSRVVPVRLDREDEEWETLLTALATTRAGRLIEEALGLLEEAAVEDPSYLVEVRTQLVASLRGLRALARG